MKFDTSPADHDLIMRIADRALTFVARVDGIRYPKHEIYMDLAAVHLNGCPLLLEDLLKSSDTDFTHDVFGIRRHIDRGTGKLLDCFCPRWARCMHEEPAPQPKKKEPLPRA